MSKQFFDARRRGLGFLRCDFERGFNRRLVDIAARTFDHSKLTHLHIHTNDVVRCSAQEGGTLMRYFRLAASEADGARDPLVCSGKARRVESEAHICHSNGFSNYTDVAEERSHEISIGHMVMTCRSADERLWLA